MLLQLNDETMNKKPWTGQTTVQFILYVHLFHYSGSPQGLGDTETLSLYLWWPTCEKSQAEETRQVSKNGDAFLVKTFIKLDALNST